MCGDSTTTPRQSLGGALAVLSSSSRSIPSSHTSSLSSSPPSPSLSPSRLTSYGGGGGTLVFHNPTEISSAIATHATFTPASSYCSPSSSSSSLKEKGLGVRRASKEGEEEAYLTIHIHQTGNLLLSSKEEEEKEEEKREKLLHEFRLTRRRGEGEGGRRKGEGGGGNDALLTMPLPRTLELGVGGEGIIGRKVSVWWWWGYGEEDKEEEEGKVVAEGILGFN